MLCRLLTNIRDTTKDKVVIVSQSTLMLDALEPFVASLGLQFMRLDGSTAADKRQGFGLFLEHI